jgi:hypothetical protein
LGLLILNAMSDAEVSYPTADSVCSYEGCQRPAWRSCPEGKCLYHSPSNGDSAETARLVWQKAREMAGDKNAEVCNFRGWHFPEDPDGRFEPGRLVGWFVGCCFDKDVWFNDATFGGGVVFDGATFGRNAVFQNATFSGYARFWGTTFTEDAWFGNAAFNGEVWFADATFRRDAFFGNAKFSGLSGFSGTTFLGEAWFFGAIFSEQACFETTTFTADAWFLNASFRRNVSFGGARFHPGANISFDRPRRGRPFRDLYEGESAYRLAKQAAQERGDYAAAGDYHYAEQCAIEDKWRSASKHKPRRKTFWLWWFRLLFGRLVYGYGERPMRPLFIALVVIFLWAGFYWLGGAIVPSDSGLEPAARAAYEPDFGECLYCSIVTFTTLGYGDYQPKEPYRLLAASEALLGAALMAVFVVCLSKKYVR